MNKPFCYVTSQADQLSLAIPQKVGVMTGESWDVNRHIAWCTSPAFLVWADFTV